MKMLGKIALTLALGGAMVPVAGALAQDVQRNEHRTEVTRSVTTTRSDDRVRRVCRVKYRHHKRIRTCRVVRS